MENTKLSKAAEDLRPVEFLIWMELHEMRLPQLTTITSLARRLKCGRSRAAVTDVLEGLRAKGYVSIADSAKKKRISLKRRLDVSAGAYARF